MGDVTRLKAPAKRDLRAAFQNEIAASGLSLTRAAEQVGRHSSSLSRWLKGSYRGNSDAVAADVARWLDTRADAAKHSLEAAGLDRHTETHAARQITNTLAYAQGTGDIVAVIGKPGRGKTWASQRYCAGKANAHFIAVSSAVLTLPGLLGEIGEQIGIGRHFASALEAERAIIERLRRRGALLVVDEAHHLRDKLLDELRIIRDRAGCGLALVADKTIEMAFARCAQVDGRIGIKLDLSEQAAVDVADIAAAILGRKPSRAELKTLNSIGRGPGGLHALRRLLGRAWMIAAIHERDQISAQDIADAVYEGAAADEPVTAGAGA